MLCCAGNGEGFAQPVSRLARVGGQGAGHHLPQLIQAAVLSKASQSARYPVSDVLILSCKTS